MPCLYTNQGGTIDEKKNDIYNILDRINPLITDIYNDINKYLNNLKKLYGNNNNNYANLYPIDNYSQLIHVTRDNIPNIINLSENVNYKFKTSLITGLLKSVPSTTFDEPYEYFNYHRDNKEMIQKFFEIYINNYRIIISQEDKMKSLRQDIEKNYKDINKNIIVNDNKIKDINKIKGNIINDSYSVSFFENLMLLSYKELYDAVYTENNVLLNNKTIKTNSYSTDNSSYIYETDKIKYYENINTFLFYFYYLLFIILIVVVFKYNTTNMMIKLTFFRIFAVIILIYPIFIFRFQNYIYALITTIYSYKPSFIGTTNKPSGTLVKPITDLPITN